MVRKPIVAGQFYESYPILLKRQLDSFFGNKGKRKEKIEGKKEINKIYGAIVPHAGYIFSGKCASKAYKIIAQLKQNQMPNLFIVLGPCHNRQATGSFSLSFEDFETPLGIVKNNKAFAQNLEKNSQARQDELAHLYEHSIEVQLPFLQTAIKDKFTFVPILISTDDYEKCRTFAKELANIIKKYEQNAEKTDKKKIMIIASSDFTHYGPNYGFVPFPYNNKTKENLYTLDKKAIEKILKLDSQGFYQQASNTTICGFTPIVILIETCKLLGSRGAILLEYYTSGDIIKDYENAVGYASILLI